MQRQNKSDSQSRLQDLAAGKIQPTNPYAAFIVQRIKETHEQSVVISQQLRNVRAQAAALEEHLIKLVGIGEQYMHDLDRWDLHKEESEDVVTPAVPLISSAPQNGVHENKSQA